MYQKERVVKYSSFVIFVILFTALFSSLVASSFLDSTFDFLTGFSLKKFSSEKVSDSSSINFEITAFDDTPEQYLQLGDIKAVVKKDSVLLNFQVINKGDTETPLQSIAISTSDNEADILCGKLLTPLEPNKKRKIECKVSGRNLKELQEEVDKLKERGKTDLPLFISLNDNEGRHVSMKRTSLKLKPKEISKILKIKPLEVKVPTLLQEFKKDGKTYINVIKGWEDIKETIEEQNQKVYTREEPLLTCSDSDGADGWQEGIVSYGEEDYTDYCLTTTSVLEYLCLSSYSRGSNIIECNEGEMCFSGKCMEGCYDTDGGDYSVSGFTYYLDDIDPASLVLEYDKCITQPTIQLTGGTIMPVEEGIIDEEIIEPAYIYERFCQEDRYANESFECDCVGGSYWEGGHCINFTERWANFIMWTQQTGYATKIVQAYSSLNESIKSLLEEYLFDVRHIDNSFYEIYKNSLENEELQINIVLLYPIEEGWGTLSLDGIAAYYGYSYNGFLDEVGKRLSISLGRSININVEERYISYDEIFFREGYYEKIEEDEPCEITFLGANFSSQIVGEIDIDFSIFNELYSYADRSPRYPPLAVFIVMGKVSPDNYLMTTGDYVDVYTNTILLETPLLFYEGGTLLHEVGHILSLPHGQDHDEEGNLVSSFPLPSIMLYDGALIDAIESWPCYNMSSRYFYFSPLERYLIEPYDGFENEEEYVQEYNEAVTCQDIEILEPGTIV